MTTGEICPQWVRLGAVLSLVWGSTLAAGLVAQESRVRLGIDVLLDGTAEVLRGGRVGLITNPSGVDGNLVPTADRLHRDPRVRLVQLFGPEHGIRGDIFAGDKVDDGLDAVTGLPVQSLYGARRAPSPEVLAKVDVLVFDIQDVGSRTYTFASTLAECLKAAAAAKKKVVVLDRPNPLGGVRFEGPVLKPEWRSFIGYGPTPVTHGMTMGELARFFNGELEIGCDLEVVRCEGWTRDMVFDDTGLAWVQTSPHIPHALQAHLYVATGMIGGVAKNVNEGVGYTLPFETIAADWIDGERLAQELTQLKLPGVKFRPLVYRPYYFRFAEQALRGVQLVLTDPREFRPLHTSLEILGALERLHPGKLEITSAQSWNRHWGDLSILERIRQGASTASIEKSWAADLKAFERARAKHLLY